MAESTGAPRHCTCSYEPARIWTVATGKVRVARGSKTYCWKRWLGARSTPNRRRPSRPAGGDGEEGTGAIQRSRGHPEPPAAPGGEPGRSDARQVEELPDPPLRRERPSPGREGAPGRAVGEARGRRVRPHAGGRPGDE